MVSLDAALMSLGPRAHSRRPMFVYRAVGAALLVVITGHLGGTLVWGEEFVTVVN